MLILLVSLFGTPQLLLCRPCRFLSLLYLLRFLHLSLPLPRPVFVEIDSHLSTVKPPKRPIGGRLSGGSRTTAMGAGGTSGGDGGATDAPDPQPPCVCRYRYLVSLVATGNKVTHQVHTTVYSLIASVRIPCLVSMTYLFHLFRCQLSA